MNVLMTIFRRADLALCRIALLLLLCATGSLAHASTMSHPEQLIDVTEQFLERTVGEYLIRSAITARHEISVNRLDLGCASALAISRSPPALAEPPLPLDVSR